MTTAKLYRKYKAGEISRDRFLYEVRRDSNLPWVTNTTSFDDAVKILKNKSIISELDANIKADPAVDRVNPYFLKAGVQNMLSKEKELTNDSYMKALNKAAKMLQKNPHVFDDLMLKNADEVEKKDAKLQTKEVKKGDLNDTDNEMKKVKVKDKTKKAKTLKETALDELTFSLKKKESINEDSHYKHHVGSEIHTPDGPGKIKEIVGSTLTIEMEDGTLKDYQINVVDKAIEKQKENQQEEASAMFMDAPLNPSYRMNKDGKRAINPDGVEFKVGDMAIAKDNNQAIKIGGFKQEQGRIKAIYTDGLVTNVIDIDGLKKQMDNVRPSLQPDLGSAFDKLKGMMEKKKGDKAFLAKMKDKLKKLKEFMSDEEIDAAKKQGDVINVPSSATADIAKLRNKKVNYSTYKG
jgi:hypothetical protein